MTPHNEAKKGDYYSTVLMPGDPLRAKFIAENFLTDVKQVNSVRNCLGFSGKYKNKEVSVQASGMGQPSLGIYAQELYTIYDVESIIRVGSCGGIAEDLNLGDIVVALTSCSDSSMTKDTLKGFTLTPACSYELLRNYTNVDHSAKVGVMTSNDYFYQPDKDWFKQFAKLGILGVDMETHMLYALSMIFNKKALSVNTVSDHLFHNNHLSSKERETGFSKMIENVLESI